MRRAALALILVAVPSFGQMLRSDQPVAPVQFGAAPGRQEFARVASDGTNFFAVWRTHTQSTVIIGGGRISAAGEAMDQPSILIASGVGDTLGYPDVVFAGGNFLVAYPSGNSILLRRIGHDGQLIDSGPIVIGTRGSSSTVLLATNGRSVLLAAGPDRIRMLTADGTPFGAEWKVPNADFGYGFGSFSVSSNGDWYLIAYATGPTGATPASFVLLGGDGSFLGAKPLPDSYSFRDVNVASNGVSWLISISTNAAVECLTVDANGNASAPRTLSNQPGGYVTATWSGSEYTLAWVRSLSTPTSITYDIVGARVDSAGAPRDATQIPITSWPTAQNYGAIFGSASNGSDTMIITSDSDRYSQDVRTEAAIFTSLAKIGAEPERRRHVALGNAASEQTGGSIASNGTLSLVAWREASGLYQAVVRAAFIAADGQLGTPIELGDAHPQSATATASDGRDFLVTYFDSKYHLVARRVTLEGLADPVPIVITDYGWPPDALAIGWSGQAYVVVTAGNPVVTISGITAEGTVAVPRQVIEVSEPADTPAVSCGVNGCRATWHTYASYCCEGGSAGNNVMAITNAAGTILSQVLLTNSGIGVTPAISLSAADSESMFIYSAARTMFAGRITAAGAILDPPALNGGVAVIVNDHVSPIPVAAVRSGIYWIDPTDDWALTGRLYWSMIDPEPRPHVVATIDMRQTVTLPLPLAAAAHRTYLVYESGDIDASLMAARLFVRTIASPDPQTSVPRRRATR